MEPDNLLPWPLLGLAVVLIGTATAIEVLYIGANRGDLRKLAERSDNRSQLIGKLLANGTRLASTVLVLKSAGLVAGGVAAVQVLMNIIGTRWFASSVFAWLTLLLFQILVRGSVARYAGALAGPLAPLARLLVQLLTPLTALLDRAGGWLYGKAAPSASEDAFANGDDLREIIHASEEENTIEVGEKEMIASILEMDDTVAREVMVPRIDMVAIDVELSLEEALDVIMAAGHSRIPVYETHVDHIIGILYAKDLLKCYRDNRADAPIRTLLRPAYFVPVSKKVNTLLKEMQKQRVHIALVVDEYGGTAGLVTIEDIIEEIVGDIQDEYDHEEDVYVQALGADVYSLNSRLDVYSLSKLLDIEVPDEDADTLGGLIYSRLGHVPEQGEAVEWLNWRFTVLALDGQRIDQVRAELIAKPDAASVKSADERPSFKQATGDNSLYNYQSSD